MKTYFMLTVLALTGALFHSCKCGCHKTCFLYNHDSIMLCPKTLMDTNFYKLNDSLRLLYGPGRDSIQGASAKSGSDQWNQLESQGYRCECPK